MRPLQEHCAGALVEGGVTLVVAAAGSGKTDLALLAGFTKGPKRFRF